LLVLSRPRGSERFTIRNMKPGELRNHISGSSVDIHIVIDVKRLFERIGHDWRAKFYQSNPSLRLAESIGFTAAYQAALRQVDAQFGRGKAIKLPKQKPKS
jgi:hypothetical protein